MIGGKFVVIDGPEGSGKTTLLKSLVAELPRAVFVREPGGTPVSERVREVLLDPGGSAISDLTQFLLFYSARSDLMEKVIRPTLEAGRDVLTDRFDSSTYAYQVFGSARGEAFENWFWFTRKQVLRDTIPDLYIFLDIDPQIGRERQIIGGKDRDHMDERSLDFHRKVRAGLKHFMATPGIARNPSVTIDASRSADLVMEECILILRKVLML